MKNKNKTILLRPTNLRQGQKKTKNPNKTVMRTNLKKSQISKMWSKKGQPDNPASQCCKRITRCISSLCLFLTMYVSNRRSNVRKWVFIRFVCDWPRQCTITNGGTLRATALSRILKQMVTNSSVFDVTAPKLGNLDFETRKTLTPRSATGEPRRRTPAFCLDSESGTVTSRRKLTFSMHWLRCFIARLERL